MMIMNKIKKIQVVMLFLLAALLFVTPLLSSSLRHTYLYFMINLLIIALGAEAGLLSAFSKPLDHHHHHHHQDKKIASTTTSTVALAPKPVVNNVAASSEGSDNTTIEAAEKKQVVRVVEKSKSEKIVGSVKMEIKAAVKKCPSMPSLFFIGDQDHVVAKAVEEVEEEEEEEEVVGGDLSGQELFTKAEMFIGNFYKQLKMQREDSWKKIHGFYQRAF